MVGEGYIRQPASWYVLFLKSSLQIALHLEEANGIFSVQLSKLDIHQQAIYIANTLLGMQPHSPLGVQLVAL